MEDYPTLKLVDDLLEIKEPTNYWTSCPLKSKSLPKKQCELGKTSCTSSKPQCEWNINSAKYNYCFWTYIYENSDEDGNMEEISQLALAELLDFSNTRIHFMIKEALEELKDALNSAGLYDHALGLDDEHVDLLPRDTQTVDHD